MGAGLVFDPGENETQVKYQAAHRELLASALATRMAHDDAGLHGAVCWRQEAFYPTAVPRRMCGRPWTDRDNYFFIDVQSCGEYLPLRENAWKKREWSLVMGPEDLSVLQETQWT